MATVTAQSPGLLITARPTEQAYERLTALVGEVREEPPYPIRLLSGDRFLVTGGSMEGQRGVFVRGADGAITGVNLGGRLALRD